MTEKAKLAEEIHQFKGCYLQENGIRAFWRQILLSIQKPGVLISDFTFPL